MKLKALVARVLSLGLCLAAAPATAPMTGPTTAPSPIEAVVKLQQIFAANDADAYAKLQSPRTPDEAAFREGVQKILAAQATLHAAYKSKVDANLPLPAYLSIIKGLPENLVRASRVTLIGDDAAEVSNPDESLGYRVKRIDGAWEIDVTATVGLAFPSDPAKAVKALSKQFNESAAACDETTAQIVSGALTTKQAVIDALSKRMNAVHQAMASLLPPAAPRTGGTIIPLEQFKEMGGKKADGAFTSHFDPVSHSSRPSVCLMSDVATPLATGNRATMVAAAGFRGKRLRFSAYLKSEGVVNFAGIGSVVGDAASKFVSFDIASNRLLRGDDRYVSGTTDWKKVGTVFDVPPDATKLMLGLQLSGAGKVWMDDARIEVVSKDVPTTDDGNIHLWSNYVSAYGLSSDTTVQHEGRPTVAIASHDVPADAKLEYVWWDRNPVQYRGHHVRLSAWVKCENASAGGGLKIAQNISNKGDTQIDSEKATRPITGTSDWTRYETTAEIAANADCVQFGLKFAGSGKLWIDDIKVVNLDAADKGL